MVVNFRAHGINQSTRKPDTHVNNNSNNKSIVGPIIDI